VKLGILGGTFDPIHVAHLRVAEEVREALGLGRVLFMPAADPPHKHHHATPEQRLEMVRLAIAGTRAFDVLDLELRRDGPSYTADTLALLGERFSGDELWFIIGTDQFRVLESWSRPEQVLARTNLAVVRRPGEKEGPLRELLPLELADQFEPECDAPQDTLRHRSGHRVSAVPITRIDVSSSMLRACLARGDSVRYLVPDSVADFIEERGLYRVPEGVRGGDREGQEAG
jgi:nicotinate-nucleotide adenylyltransferase